MRIVTHLGGIEWQRSKWGPTARAVLKRSEAMAVRWSHHVIADNPEIADHIRSRYGRDTVQIAYGHEHALAAEPADIADLDLPPLYALALARAEPENNLELILETLAARADEPPLIAMATWEDAAHGRKIHARYRGHPRIRLLHSEYDPGRLRAILYLHGHSAGGTNPALVEMVGFGVPVAAWDCVFNRATTGNRAAYFDNASALDALIDPLLTHERSRAMGTDLKALAQTRYRWRDVTAAYFDLLGL
jgi:glycosyltransferase involved in cell wall biosynthesis